MIAAMVTTMTTVMVITIESMVMGMGMMEDMMVTEAMVTTLDMIMSHGTAMKEVATITIS
jgi:hypothetical protein